MANNPYAPPSAVVADIHTEIEFQPVKIWSASGRIGRLRYLAYNAVATLITIFCGGILGAILIPLLGPTGILLVYLPLVVFHVLCLIKRSHDMDWNGWTSVVAMLIPFAAFVWLFKAGTQGENSYGAPPPPNTTGVKILGFGAPVLGVVLIGIMAAIAIPAYQKYVERSKASQHSQPVQSEQLSDGAPGAPR